MGQESARGCFLRRLGRHREPCRFRQLFQIGLDHGRAVVAPEIGPFRIDNHRLIARTRRADELLRAAAGQQTLAVIGEQRHAAFAYRRREAPEHGIKRLRSHSVARFRVGAHDLLGVGDIAGLDDGLPSGFPLQEPLTTGQLTKDGFDFASRDVIANNRKEANGAAECVQIADRVARAAQHRVLFPDMQYGHRSLRRDAAYAAIDEAVEHHIARAADNGPVETLHHRRQTVEAAHAPNNSRSRPAQKMWPRRICIS